VCEAGYSGVDCSVVVGGILVRRCPNSCNGHGECLFGKCMCYPGWTGRDCLTPLVTPCENDCNAQGVCFLGRCFCNPGYEGFSCDKVHDCTLDCGSHGVCMQGKCVCAFGFGGQDCTLAVDYVRPEQAAAHPTKPPPPTLLQDDDDDDEHVYHVATTAGNNNAAAAAPLGADLNDIRSIMQFRETRQGGARSSEGDSMTVSSVAAADARRRQYRRRVLEGSLTEMSAAVQSDSLAFPIVPLILVAFLSGVLVSSFARFLLDKRDQMKRQQDILKPLLVPS